MYAVPRLCPTAMLAIEISPGAGWHTVSVHWHIQISDLAIVAEDLAEVLLVDILGEFLNDDLSRLVLSVRNFIFSQFSPLCSG